MLSIDDLMQIERPTTTVKVGGREITLRALLSYERQAIGASWPEPAPPIINNLNTGEKLRDETNPTYLQKVDERLHAIGCGIVALSMEYMVGGSPFPLDGKVEARRAWIEGASRELSQRLTTRALVSMSDAILHLEEKQFDAGDRIGTEKKPGN